jgi:AbrB family looped-hinge helix DNA binding protein
MGYKAVRPQVERSKRTKDPIYARVSVKNQIVIPSEVRERLKLNPGDDIGFSENGAGEIVVRRRLRIDDLCGILEGCPPFEREPDDPLRYGSR